MKADFKDINMMYGWLLVVPPKEPKYTGEQEMTYGFLAKKSKGYAIDINEDPQLGDSGLIRMPVDIPENSQIFYFKNAGMEIELSGTKYILLNADNVIMYCPIV